MQNEQEHKRTEGLVAIINKLLVVIAVLVISIVTMPFILFYKGQPDKPATPIQNTATTAEPIKTTVTNYWAAPAVNSITDGKQKEQVVYGQELIAHTAKYLGPSGSVSKISNGMNCQNCHLQAGTAVFANNYGSVASLYPKFRARSGQVEDIYKRVNDCFERSLNGKALSKTSKEMQAITAYINFVGSNFEKAKKPRDLD